MGIFSQWLETTKNESQLDRMQVRSDKAMDNVGNAAYASGKIKGLLVKQISYIMSRNPKLNRTKIVQAMKAALDEIERGDVNQEQPPVAAPVAPVA